MIRENILNENHLSIFGEPKGDIKVINEILSEALLNENTIDFAYNLIIEFKSENINRLGLFLDFSIPSKDVMKRISEFCLENIGDMDIFHMNELSLEMQEKIRDSFVPFYRKK